VILFLDTVKRVKTFELQIKPIGPNPYFNVFTDIWHPLCYTLKNAELFQPKFGSNMDKPKCWVKNEIKNVQLKVKVLTQHLGF